MILEILRSFLGNGIFFIGLLWVLVRLCMSVWYIVNDLWILVIVDFVIVI